MLYAVRKRFALKDGEGHEEPPADGAGTNSGELYA